MPYDSGQEGFSLFDLHCDTLDRIVLYDGSYYPGFSQANAGIPRERMSSLYDNDAHISCKRMEGNTWCQCFAAFIPDTVRGDEAWSLFQRAHDLLKADIVRHPASIEQVFDAREIDRILGERKCAALLTVEGGALIGEDLARVSELAQAGVKMVTLTWNGHNAIGSGHEGREGLSNFGKAAVRAMEEHRIVVDVSHLNDEGFKDLAAIATRPFAASHSNSRVVCGHPRNLTDSQFQAISERGGIVGLNFCDKFLKDQGGDPSRDDVLRHIDHWLELGGEDAVALGSDYDGCDVPSWLVGIEKVCELGCLFTSEFGIEISEKVCFGNARRFFLQNEVR